MRRLSRIFRLTWLTPGVLQEQEAVIPPLTEAAWGADPWPAACAGDPRLPAPSIHPTLLPFTQAHMMCDENEKPASNTLCRNEIQVPPGEGKSSVLAATCTATRFAKDANRKKMQNIKVTKGSKGVVCTQTCIPVVCVDIFFFSHLIIFS